MTLVATLTLAAAAGPIVWLARTRLLGLQQWLVASSAAATLSGSALVVGPWALLSVYLRPFLLIGLIVAIAAAAYRAVRAPRAASPARWSRRRLALQAVTAFLFGLVLIDGLAGRVAPDGTTDLHFPLEEGPIAVLQGGNGLVLNSAHHWFPSDRYALDLVKLNRFGNRARGIAPASLDDYATYDVAVHSPCAGMVDGVVHDVPDHAPGATDPAHRSGNHVQLRCGELLVLLAHLRRAPAWTGPALQS
jgi:hypothetical protein